MAPVIGVIAASVIGAGATIYTAKKAESRAKEDAAKQQKLIDEQDKKIEEEERKQQAVAGERKKRRQQTQLLTGSERGLTGETEASLLGGA